jgi:ferredoxin
MCEFCHLHGEGKKWYLDARNYSEDLLSDIRRRGFIKKFFDSPNHLSDGDRALGKLGRFPAFLTRGIRRKITERQKVKHFGQVVPIEDVETILGFTTSVVRLACLCRHSLLGGEHRHCYGLSLAPGGGEVVKLIREADPTYLIGPQTGGLEFMSGAEALEDMKNSEKDGLCHSVWTFVTPFLAGLCNCSLPGCMAMRASLTYRTPVMFRAEYVARVDPEKCSGCGLCTEVCPFNAFSPHEPRAKARIDLRKCYGCGVCRSVCAKGALGLFDRDSAPETASLWL